MCALAWPCLPVFETVTSTTLHGNYSLIKIYIPFLIAPAERGYVKDPPSFLANSLLSESDSEPEYSELIL